MDTTTTSTTYNHFSPSDELAPYVACYWTITGDTKRPATKIRVLPDGCMDAIFDLTGGLTPLGVQPDPQERPSAFITGVSSVPMVVSLPACPRIVAIRFKPGGAAPLINAPAWELAETSADIDDLMPGFANLATSLIGEVKAPKAMVRVMDKLLLERLHRVPKTDAITAHAVSAMARNLNSLRINTLVSEMGMTQKKLERTLLHHAGLTPKRLGRTIRFISAIHRLDTAPTTPLASLALDLGYSDQAHFNRDFKALSGLAPTRWLAERTSVDFLQYTPIQFA
ncbi:MAG: helix-turn-helix domain-containing protein [Pseudodesulfovibrio sp.]